MPLYEYYCPTCRVEFEQLRPISQASEDAACPTCQGAAQKQLSVFLSYSKSSSGAVQAVAGGGCPACSAGGCGCH